MKSRLLPIYIFLFFALSASGCAVQNSRQFVKRGIVEGIMIEDNAYKPKLIHEEYVLEAPDQINISVVGNPELNRQTVIRPDGVISFDLIGKVPIAGLTVSEAEKLIEDRLAEYLKEVDVTIEVSSFDSKKIYVFGRVPNQGPQPFTGNNDVLDALANAGVVTPGASIQNVLVVRKDKVNPKIIPVNFKLLATKGIAAEDVQLRPDDIVLVTPNVFGRTEEVVSTILLPVGPITSPVFTLDSLDDTFGLDLAGNNSSSSNNSASSNFAGATAATAATTTATTTTGTP